MVATFLTLLASSACGTEAPTAPLVPTVPPLPTELGSLRIVFQRSGGAEHRIIAMNADGSDLIPLAEGLWPDVSPDGTRIAFAMHSAEPGVYVTDAAGSLPTLVAPLGDGWFADPDWSPDGRRIGFIDFRGYDEGSYLAHAPVSGGAVQYIGGGPGYDAMSGPAWSPDGTRIAVSLGGHVWTATVDGSVWTPVTLGEPLGGRHAVWSPDGTRIAFAGVETLTSTIEVASADGSRIQTILLGAPGERVAPTDWSRDGDLILLTKIRGPSWDRGEIWLLRLSDGGRWRITDGSENDAGAKFWPRPVASVGVVR